MIRFGPAGIPLSCKGRTLIDGIEDVYALGLSAMELQLVRMNEIERYPMEEEVGLPLRDLTADLVLQLRRGQGEKRQIVSNPDEKVREGDALVAMISGPASNFKELTYARKLAKKLDIALSLHSPYYMDLTSLGPEGQQSVQILQWAGIIAKEMDAAPVVTHIGLYEGRTPQETYANVRQNLKGVAGWYKREGIPTRIGIEMSGRQEVFGTIDEVLRLCAEIDGLVPVVNIPHIHARGGGSLLQKDQFIDLFKKTEKRVGKTHYVHFAGVEHEDGNEIRYTPIKKGDLRFEPMAEALIDKLYDMTVISGSPLLEHDAMYMRVIFERNFARTVSKAAEEAFEGEDDEAPPQKKKSSLATGKAPVQKGKSPVKKPASPQKGKTPAKKPAVPQKGKTPAKKSVAPQKGKTPAKKPAAPQKGKTPAKKPAAPQKGKTPAKKPAVPLKGKASVKKPATPQKGKAPAKKPAAPQKGKTLAKPPAKKVPAKKKPAPKAAARLKAAKAVKRKTPSSKAGAQPRKGGAKKKRR